MLSLIYPYTSPALPPLYIYIELAPKLTETASAAQSVERWSRDPGLRVQFAAFGGLGGAFFAIGPGMDLKMHIIFLTLDFTLH